MQLNRAATWMTNLCLILGMVAVASWTVACTPSAKKPDEISADADVTGGNDSDSGGAMGMESINFPYDSYTLTAESKMKLDANAQILSDKRSVQIQIEGHCDERGGIQYNLALGEKRANAVRKYLVDKGVKGDRITTISFGEERPLDTGHTEAAWGRNRRANFVITSR
ncbi:MAG: peptidoglycan-associated lipoprotein Pal [Bdellovibrionales bacterium]|nr:peptidoglycan-associated lipoprotein Pal [Bdellovibrionales bacterium]